MTKKQADLEFERLNKEIDDKPKCKTPYPYDIIKTRELLLIAQVLLSQVLDAKKAEDKFRESFLTMIYKLTLRQYFSCKRDYLLQY